MKTLPTNIQNGRDGGSEPIYLVRLIPESGDSWSEYRWATKAISITGSGSYAGGRLMKNGLPSLEESIDVLNGPDVGHVGNFKINLLNQDKYHETLDFINNHFVNREIEVYLVFWTGGALSTSDWLCLKSGIIKEVDYSIEKITFDCVDAGEKRHKIIPDKKIDIIDYPNCPKENIGKVMPLIYGEMHSGDSHLGTRIECPMVRIDKVKEKYLVSLNKMKHVAQNEADRVGSLFEENSGMFMQFHWPNMSEVGTFVYARPSTYEFPATQLLDFLVRMQPGVRASKTDPSSLDPSNAIDSDENSYFNWPAGSDPERIFFKMKIPKDMFTIREGTYISLKINFGTISGTGTAVIRYYNQDWDNGTGKYSTGKSVSVADSDTQVIYYVSGAGGYYDYSAHGKMDDQSDQDDPWMVEEINSYEWGIAKTALLNMQIKNIYFQIHYPIVRRDAYGVLTKVYNDPIVKWRWRWYHAISSKIELIDNVCGAIKGTIFGSWIDADGRDNGYDQNDLIENGAYIVEDILRAELGLTSNEINYQSFDDIGNTTDGERKNWKFAMRVAKENDSLDIVREFCQNCWLIYFTDYENKEKVTDLPKQSDIGSTSRTLDIIKLTNPKAGKSSIKIGKISVKNIYTDFFLKYRQNRMTDNYEKMEYCNPDESSIGSIPKSQCIEANTNFKIRRTYTFEANWIDDETTARNLLTLIVEWFHWWHYPVGFTTSLNAVDLELADRVKIDHPFLPSGIRNNKIFMVTSIRLNCNKDEIQLKLIQIQK